MRNRHYRLIIDPGHGGKDPGAVNKRLGIKEKDINLSVALLMRRFCWTGDYLFNSYMTRRKDEFVSLAERCKKADFFKVNAFMSIHTNARPMKGKPGIEIEVFHYPGSKRGREFANITLGLLLGEVRNVTEVISRGAKEKAFYVLKHNTMPAILVELGFISDDEEALFLNEPINQKMIAKALLEPAELFFEGGESEWTTSQN